MYRMETMARFDERIPAADFVGTCEGCGELILKGEDHFGIDGDLVHDDSTCIREHFKSIADFKS